MALQDETKMHWVIIAVLSLSIILLLVHINQMNKGAEAYANVQSQIVGYSGTLTVGDTTPAFQQLLDIQQEDGFNPYTNPMVGPSENLEGIE